MQAALKAVAWRIVPAFMADRAARYERALRDGWGLQTLAQTFITAHGDRVLAGPMKGLRYTATGDAPVAKLLGAYEREIGPWLEEALCREPTVFVDLGAADGYYAVGVKARCPAARVIAFELSAVAREELHALAAANKASVEIRGEATVNGLRDLQLENAVVLCDIEGHEANVLRPAALESCTIIVEMHEHACPGVTRLLIDRFGETHHSEVVSSLPRDPAEYPELTVLPDEKRPMALAEHRAREMAWVRFTPR